MSGVPSRDSPSKALTAAQQRGRQAEDHALAFLIRQHLVLLGRNVRYRVGELDLVMRDGTTLVFIEVRSRQRPCFGVAADTINAAKQRRLVRAAQCWLQRHRYATFSALRFDVVAIDDGHLRWIPNAFDGDRVL